MILNIHELHDSLMKHVTDCFPVNNGYRRIEMECAELSPLQWLSGQAKGSRYYWTNRSRSFEMAGVGECDVIEPGDSNEVQGALTQIRAKMPMNCRNTRYYGGFRFHRGAPTNERWYDFKAYRFVLPLLELCRANGRYYIACNISHNLDRDEVVRVVNNAAFSTLGTQDPLPAFTRRTDQPDAQKWAELVNSTLEVINSQRLQKAVLARQSTFHADASIDAVALLKRLALCSENTYLFCFEPTANRAFLGASPELLYKRCGHHLSSEALAGTRPRGDTPLLEHRYEQELLDCDKEHREHQIVVDYLRTVLNHFCETLTIPSVPSVMKLACCQHLHTPIEGILSSGHDDQALLEALHPTPAVGGLPKEDAVRWILENEPFERGIYAAPVGWVGLNEAEFCVGIRSGLVQGNTLSLYAGAGIVAGAKPEEEWRELDAKMANFLSAITKDA